MEAHHHPIGLQRRVIYSYLVPASRAACASHHTRCDTEQPPNDATERQQSDSLTVAVRVLVRTGREDAGRWGIGDAALWWSGRAIHARRSTVLVLSTRLCHIFITTTTVTCQLYLYAISSQSRYQAPLSQYSHLQSKPKPLRCSTSIRCRRLRVAKLDDSKLQPAYERVSSVAAGRSA